MLRMRYVLIAGMLSIATACGPAQEDAASDDAGPGAFDTMTRSLDDARQVEEINQQQKRRMDAAIEATQ